MMGALRYCSANTHILIAVGVTAACSDKVILADFDRSADLPTGRTVAVEFARETPGEYELACAMETQRGRLIVERRRTSTSEKGEMRC